MHARKEKRCIKKMRLAKSEHCNGYLSALSFAPAFYWSQKAVKRQTFRTRFVIRECNFCGSFDGIEMGKFTSVAIRAVASCELHACDFMARESVLTGFLTAIFVEIDAHARRLVIFGFILLQNDVMAFPTFLLAFWRSVIAIEQFLLAIVLAQVFIARPLVGCAKACQGISSVKSRTLLRRAHSGWAKENSFATICEKFKKIKI